VKHTPNFLPGELREQFQTTDLTFEYFAKKIAESEAAKRDSIPASTVNIWFIETVRRNWDKETLDERCIALMSKKVFGAVQFDDLLEAQRSFTYAEIRCEAERLINYRIAEVKRYKGLPGLTDEEKKNVQLAAWKEIDAQKRIHKSNLLAETFEEEKLKLAQEFVKKEKAA